MFVTYLTIYDGDKLPPFYIGSTSAERVERGYHGSVRGAQFKNVWQQELLDHPELFDTIVLSEHATREEALTEEQRLHVKHNVVRDKRFVNTATARGGFINRGYWTEEEKARMSASAKLRGQPKPHHRSPRILLGPEGMKANATAKRHALAALKKSSKTPKPAKIKMSREQINARISNALIGHTVSAETRAKLAKKASAAHTGRKQTPDQIAKRVASRQATLNARNQHPGV